MSENIDPALRMQVLGFATKRTKKLAGLIDSAPPLRPEQIADLISRLEKHPVIETQPTKAHSA